MLTGNHWQLSGIPSGRTNFNSGHVEPYLSHATPSHVPAQIAPPAWVSRHTIPSGFLAASYFAYCVMSSDQKEMAVAPTGLLPLLKRTKGMDRRAVNVGSRTWGR